MLRNEYYVTKELYLRWKKDERRRGLQLSITVMWSAILIILVTATAVYLIYPFKTENSPWLALEIALILYAIYELFGRRPIAARNMYKKMSKQLGENWLRVIVFGDKVITVIDGDVEVDYPYSEIDSVTGAGDEILITTDKKQIIRVYKDKFESGDYGRFKRFIESKVVNRCMLT